MDQIKWERYSFNPICALSHGHTGVPVVHSIKARQVLDRTYVGKEFMTTISKSRTPFIIRFVNAKPRILLELTNTTETTLKAIEILTVFLKDEGPGAGSSRAHIRFERINSLQPQGKAVVSHKTWINGAPVSEAQDQIGRLEAVAGAVKPYVLDISWEDLEGKTQFQRIPVGH